MKDVMNKEVIDPDTEEFFDYLNTDVHLLTLNILLEGFYRGQNTFTLDQFLKGNYWKIDYIKGEVQDTNDFGSIEDMVLHQIIDMIDGLNIAKVRRLSVKDISGLLELAVKKAIQTENPTDDDISYFTAVINEIYDIKKLNEVKIDAIIQQKTKVDFKNFLNAVNFEDSHEAARHLNFISSIAAPHIEIEITFIDEVAKEIDKMIEDYLFSFSQDNYVEQKPPYKQKRYYFSKQLENFCNYIKDFPAIDGSINIPFSVLEEQGFEAVKVLSFLERERKIKVRNWNDIDMWNVKFHIVPITLQSLVSGVAEIKSEGSFKGNLSFNEAKSVLEIGEKTIKIRKASDQYHLLRIIFQDKKEIAQEWFYSEIAEKYDEANQFDDKKFYNAAYQVKQKVVRDTGLQDVLFTTAQSVRINPKYLN